MSPLCFLPWEEFKTDDVIAALVADYGKRIPGVSHLTIFSCALKRPREAVGGILLDQEGVRLFGLTALPPLYHIIQPLVVTLRANTPLAWAFITVPSFLFLTVTLPQILTAKNEKVQLAEHVVSKTKVMRDSSLFSLALDADWGSLSNRKHPPVTYMHPYVVCT